MSRPSPTRKVATIQIKHSVLFRVLVTPKQWTRGARPRSPDHLGKQEFEPIMRPAGSEILEGGGSMRKSLLQCFRPQNTSNNSKSSRQPETMIGTRGGREKATSADDSIDDDEESGHPPSTEVETQSGTATSDETSDITTCSNQKISRVGDLKKKHNKEVIQRYVICRDVNQPAAEKSVFAHKPR